MRIGENPQKKKQLETGDFFHQIIVPVYIPETGDYYKDAFRIFRACLSSILATVHENTFITIVNNGSCSDVRDYLDKAFADGAIHELIHTANIGKVNAIFKGLTGQKFDLVTFSDADVFYASGWQQEVYDTFTAFPKAGSVCTTPNSRAIKYLTSNLFFDKLFSKDLRFTDVLDPEPMKHFARSVGRESFLREIHLKTYLTVSSNGKRALAGSGHYTCTFRGDIFDRHDFTHTSYLVGSVAMHDYIDRPVIEAGFWRLSTEKNFTWHMGNTFDGWMEDNLRELSKPAFVQKPELSKPKSSGLMNRFKSRVFSRWIYAKKWWPLFLWHKGLAKSMAGRY